MLDRLLVPFARTPVRTRRVRPRFEAGVEPLEARTLTTVGLGHALPSHPSPVTGTGTIKTTRSGELSVKETAPRTFMNLGYLNDHGRVHHLDLYVPGGPKPGGGYPVILAIPGGGWRWVRRSDLGATVSSFTRDGFAVAVADYSFASDKPGTAVWPQDLHDLQQAVRWLKSKSGRFGLDPDRVAAWGESAGGNLAALLGTTSGSAGSDQSANVKAVVDFYGPTELTQLYQDAPKTRPYLETFLGGPPSQYLDRYRAASPAEQVTSNDPPFMIIQGTVDTAVPLSQSANLVQALTASRVPVTAQFLQGQPHGFRLNVGFDLRGQIVAFLRSAFKGKGVVSG